MPVGLKFQRKHRFLGYKLKYIYYFIARRNILQKKKSYGKCNADKVRLSGWSGRATIINS